MPSQTTNPPGPSDPADPRHTPTAAPHDARALRVVLLSGVSGSGKTIALNSLEDAGYYCVDNLPAQLVDELLAVTHLAQVAAAASRHLQVDKASRGGRSFSSVRALEPQARVLEIARMLGGDASSEVALAHAREMLQAAAVPAAPARARRARAKAG